MNRKPDYAVKALDKTDDTKGTVGAAWKNEDGSVSVVLDPFITLTQRNGNLLVTLFPRENPPKPAPRPGAVPGYE